MDFTLEYRVSPEDFFTFITRHGIPGTQRKTHAAVELAPSARGALSSALVATQLLSANADVIFGEVLQLGDAKAACDLIDKALDSRDHETTRAYTLNWQSRLLGQ